MPRLDREPVERAEWLRCRVAELLGRRRLKGKNGGMCFELDSTPPIAPVSGGAAGFRETRLTAADGSEFSAFEVFARDAKDAAVIVLPDVRGLYPFYEELAMRFAEHGYDAIAIDYFGRTAGTGKRDESFEFREHVAQTTFEGVRADVAATVAHLRRADADRKIFVIGFCFGGSNAWHQAANGFGLAGVVGFYGHPNREFPQGAPPVIKRVGEMECPVLGLMGGDDPGIPESEVSGFREALTAAGVSHEIVTYPGAPHSFFDRRFEEFAAESADAWSRVLAFCDTYGR